MPINHFQRKILIVVMCISSDSQIVKDVIYCMNYGEVIELNDTISIQCISINHGSTYCGWIFKPVHGEKAKQRDILYIPFNETITSSISSSSTIPSFSQMKRVCIGGTRVLPVKDIPSFNDLYTFIRMCTYFN